MADASLAVVLAAGHGTRMRSAHPKVLHRLAGRTLIDHVLDLAGTVSSRRPVVVVSPAHPEVGLAVRSRAAVVEQPQSRGTGDALRSLPAELRDAGPVLVLSGDVPLLRPATVVHLLDSHARSGAACTLLSFIPPNPTGLGRVVRGPDGTVLRIIEQRDLSPPADALAECNGGVYVIDGARLWPALDRLATDNAQGEHYLTQVVELIEGPVHALLVGDPTEAMGINDRVELAAAAVVVRRRILDGLMLAGVGVEDPATTYVDAGVRIGVDTEIAPMTTISGTSVIGSGCRIGPGAQLRDVVVGDRVEIGPSFLEDCELGDGVTIGPYNRLRPGTRLDAGVRVGTHAEVKNSTVGEGSHINHVACVLDSTLGAHVNVGAGTVTCNYDGAVKSRTTIGDRVFVGSGSMLVAPLSLGEDAYIGAGSTITADVPSGALAVERAEARLVPGYRERRRRAAATSVASGGDHRS